MTYLEKIESKICKDQAQFKQKFNLLSGIRVFTNGCFDLLHRGHIDYLCRARDLGDHLVVALNSDSSVSRLKGKARPIQVLEDRMFLMAALESVSLVLWFNENTPESLLSLLQPEIHTKGGDYTPESLPEKSIIDSYGGQIRILPFISGKSSTSLIQKLTD